eukprot:CAMPEP_0182421600 /NCGR_PEP_ID=MMETSP1167-20130531/7005_1 /TAXON_ID=2988 /ORGANISM="Mallomonas Sp, Strain CCMP3275" /LENGTH=527 /DNA_ID=CAMNT_0024598855 /DNA_START=147 /DNA_END=1730 /DNA_ORIENTATION=+
MGAAASTKYSIHDYDILNLSSTELEKISALFRIVDKEHKGVITLSSLLNYLAIPQTSFLEKLFKLLDSNQFHGINIKTFIFLVWNYCTICDTKVLATFIYQLYSNSNKGVLETEDCITLLQEINGETGKESVSFISPELKDELFSLSLSQENFLTFILSHPSLLDPVVQFQRKLLCETLGEKEWREHGVGRESVCEYNLDATIAFLRRHIMSAEDNNDPDTSPGTNGRRKPDYFSDLQTTLSNARSVMSSGRSSHHHSNGVNTPVQMGSFKGSSNEKEAERERERERESKTTEDEVTAFDENASVPSSPTRMFLKRDEQLDDADGTAPFTGVEDDLEFSTPTKPGLQPLNRSIVMVPESPTPYLNSFSEVAQNQSQTQTPLLPKPSVDLTSGGGKVLAAAASVAESVVTAVSPGINSGGMHDRLPPVPKPATTKANSNYYKDDHSAVVVKAEVKITHLDHGSTRNSVIGTNTEHSNTRSSIVSLFGGDKNKSENGTENQARRLFSFHGQTQTPLVKNNHNNNGSAGN